MTTETLTAGAVRSRSRSASDASAGGPGILSLLFYVALVIAIFFAMIYFRIALDRSAFELDRIETSIELERTRQLDLRLELAELQDPLRITNEAQRIGLTHPTERIPLVVTAVAETAEPIATDDAVQALPGAP